MANFPVKIIGGDFVGNGWIQFGVLWSGPSSEKFQGIGFSTPEINYKPSDVNKLMEMQREKVKSFLGASIAAGAGMLLFGGVGLIAGALAGGNKHQTVAVVEFTDGKKFAFSVDLNNKVYLCMKLFAIEKRIYQHSF